MAKEHTGQGACGAIEFDTHQKFIADCYRKVTQKAVGGERLLTEDLETIPGLIFSAVGSRIGCRARIDKMTLSLGSQP